jgi:hypothetical protein
MGTVWGEEYIPLREVAYKKRLKATALNHSATVFEQKTKM